VFARPYYDELARIAPFPLRFEGLALRATTGAAFDLEDDTFDLAVSHEVFEHIKDVAGVVRELRRVLRPGGRTYLYIHNYTSLSGGHHIAWKYPDTEPSCIVPPWDHLRRRMYVDIPSWVNGMREREYRAIFEHYFEIEDWFSVGDEGEALLTPEIEAELAAYSRRELLSKGFVVVGRPRK
jgi:SAM-dependent methyltransferase